MKLGAGTSKPERVLGLHFFNPVPVLPLVEVVRSIMTGDEALERARSFAQDTLGKVCIDSQDRAGFVVNALLIPYLLSAIRMYESGFASKEDIDEGMIKGCAHPMGPLALADLIGLDTLLAVSRSRSTRSSAIPRPSRPRCSTGWSRPGCWAARAGAASTTTRRWRAQPRIDEWRATTCQRPLWRDQTSVRRNTLERFTVANDAICE